MKRVTRCESQEGTCLQCLEHDDEILSCNFSYDGDAIITGSKDNTCRIWKDASEQS